MGAQARRRVIPVRQFFIRYLIAGLLVCALTGCTLALVPDVQREPFSLYFQTPQQDALVEAGSTVQIVLVANDNVGSGIARVDLMIDDVLYQQGRPVENIAVPVFTVEMSWTPARAGTYALTAVAYRTDGTTSPIAALRVNVGERSSVWMNEARVRYTGLDARPVL
jgi:hypothetical protein